MKKYYLLILITLPLSLGMAESDSTSTNSSGVARITQSLENLLKGGGSGYQEQSDETKKAWAAIVDVLGKNDYDHALEPLKQFDSIKEEVEPYQKTFCQMAIQILNESSHPSTMATADTMPENQAIPQVQAQINDLNDQIKALGEKKAPLYKSIQDAQSNAQPNGLDSQTDIARKNSIANAKIETINRSLRDIDQQISELKSKIRENESKINQLGWQSKFSADKKNREKDSAGRDFQRKVANFLRDLNTKNHFAETIALANLWLNKHGAETEISDTCQKAVDLQKIEVEAHKIADVALQPAQELIHQRKFWAASDSIEHAMQTIRNQMTDYSKRSPVERAITQGKLDVDKTIASAKRESDGIVVSSQVDAESAMKKLEDFKAQYPDYPHYEQDRARIHQQREIQAEKKYEAKLEEIQTVASRRTKDARALIKQLLQTPMDETESSIIKAKLSVLNVMVLENDLNPIRSDIIKAQTSMIQYSVEHPEEFKQGVIPDFNLKLIFSDIEPLTKGKEIQSGIIVRLQNLLQEDIDDVGRKDVSSQLDGALKDVQKTINAIATHQRNKNFTEIISGVGLFIVISGSLFLYFKFRK